MKIGIIYFSTSCSDLEIEQSELCTKVDLKILIDGVETKFENTKELLDYMKINKTVAKTSQPSTGEIIDAYKESLTKFDHLLVVTPTKRLSGTHQNALLAAKDFSDSITLIESKSFAMSEFIIIKHIIKSINEKKDLSEIVSSSTKKASKFITYVVPGSFEYMRLSGRISLPKALIAGILKFKVIIKYKESGDDLADIFYKARGYKSIFKKIDEIMADNAKIIHYTSLNEQPELKSNFLDLVKEHDFQFVDTKMGSQIVAAHFGYNSFAFCIELKD